MCHNNRRHKPPGGNHRDRHTCSHHKSLQERGLCRGAGGNRSFPATASLPHRSLLIYFPAHHITTLYYHTMNQWLLPGTYFVYGGQSYYEGSGTCPVPRSWSTWGNGSVISMGWIH